MSHFTVLVIGDNPETQLAPFHEFECTGEDDQYVVEVDLTEQYREEYNTKKCDRLKDTNGNLHSFFTEDGDWKPEFSEPDAQFTGDSRRKRFIPEGYTEVEVMYKDCCTFAEFVRDYHGCEVIKLNERPDLTGKHKYGWVKVFENGAVAKAVRRTNPNSKWDWYKLGGRWHGFWTLKPGVLRGYTTGAKLGEPSWGEQPAGPGKADSARKRDIAFKAMRSKTTKEAGDKWDNWYEVTKDFPQAKAWSEIVKQEDLSIECRREMYAAQPAIKAWEEYMRSIKEYQFDCAVDQYGYDRDAYVKRRYNGAFSTFAFIHEGVWVERGEMGWFGVTHNEKNIDDWTEQFNKMIDELPEDTLLSVYDCHI